MEPLLQRFTEKYTINQETGCWEWQGARNPQGYGWISAYGRRSAAHRVSYELFKGKISLGMLILHSCDNPCCVNPEHLREGTHSDNMQDCLERERHYQSNLQGCPKCGGEYSLNANGARICNPCFKAYNKELYNKTKEKVLARQMANRDLDREAYNAKEREYRKEYRKKNAARIKERQKECAERKRLDTLESTKLQ